MLALAIVATVLLSLNILSLVIEWWFEDTSSLIMFFDIFALATIWILYSN